MAKTRPSSGGDRATAGGLSHLCPVTKEGREGEKEGQRKGGKLEERWGEGGSKESSAVVTHLETVKAGNLSMRRLIL